MWSRQLLDCLDAFFGYLGQGEIICLNDGCPIPDYPLSAWRKPVVNQMTDQQFQLFIWSLLGSQTCLLPDDCQIAGPMSALQESPGRDGQAG
jgi:hypothetical protein